MRNDLLGALAAVVGEKNVLAGERDAAPYLTDWRRQFSGAAACVVRPASTAEVSAVVPLCAQAGVAIVPQGGNTGLVGGSVPTGARPEIVLQLGRMNRIRSLDALNDTVTAEAGCVLADVQRAADGAGRLFALSLAAEGSCQIGGNLSTNAGGVNVLRYGNARDQVLGLEAVLPDGRLWDGLRALRKDNTGYDLKQLFIGRGHARRHHRRGAQAAPEAHGGCDGLDRGEGPAGRRRAAQPPARGLRRPAERVRAAFAQLHRRRARASAAGSRSAAGCRLGRACSAG